MPSTQILTTETLGKVMLALRYVTEHDRDLTRSRALAVQALDALRVELHITPFASEDPTDQAAAHERV